MESIVHLSSKGQMVIPKGIRERLHLKQGVCLKIQIHGHSLVMEPVESYSRKLLGLGKDLWHQTNPTEYLRRERKAWEKKK